MLSNNYDRQNNEKIYKISKRNVIKQKTEKAMYISIEYGKQIRTLFKEWVKKAWCYIML